MTDVQEIITSRRTVYRYSDEQVDVDLLEMSFEAARNAPCHKNTNPWKFYVLGKEARKELIPEVEKLAIMKASEEEIPRQE